MGWFASDYLPPENSFFDRRGIMPPATRFFMQIPDEYTEGPLAQFVNLDQLKDTLVQRFRGAAQRNLWVFRQGRELGTIDIVRQSRQIADGVFMDYRSQFGGETVMMTFAEGLVREVIESSDAATCMLVLYGGNRVAAIPMKDIADPKVAYSTAVGADFGAPGYWKSYSGPVFYHVTQIKVAKNISPMATELNFSGGVVNVPAVGEAQYVYNTANSLFKNAAATQPINGDNVVTSEQRSSDIGTITFSTGAAICYYKWDGFLRDGFVPSSRSFDFIAEGIYYKWVLEDAGAQLNAVLLPNSDWFTYSAPILNSDGSRIWNERGDEFAVSGSSISLTKPGPTLTQSTPSGPFALNWYQSVYSIDNTGKRIGKISGQWYPYPFDLRDLVTHEEVTAQIVHGDGEGLSHSREIDDLTYEYWTSTTQMPIPYWKKDNGVDKYVDTETVDFFANVATDGTTIGSRSITPDPGYYFSGYYTFYGHPYSTGAAMDKTYAIEFVSFPPNAGYPFHANLLTPYGVLDASLGVWSFLPWMHLSNGKNTLQAFIHRTASARTRYIYLDGVDYGSKLAAALGCSIDEIRACFFDIKLSEIRKLT
jgi:hypothetical protein